jgi:OOP family OmpA-OmpF porin
MVTTDFIFMKSYKTIVLFLFVFTTVFSQEKINSSVEKDSSIAKVANSKWSIELGTGISNGTRPYTEGYYTSVNNKLFGGFLLNCYTVGATYKFSEIVAVKMDIAFDRFTNNPENRSKPFEVANYRTTIQAVFNFNSWIRPVNYVSRFNILVHAGINIAIMYPIASDFNKIVSPNDNYGGLVYGITPIYRISKNISIFADVSSFNNYGQNLTWNGKHSALSNNAEGHMYSTTLGLSFALNNNKKQNQVDVNKTKLDTEVSIDKAVNPVIAVDPVKTEVKIETVVPTTTSTTIITEGMYTGISDTDLAKKLINDGYVAVYFNTGDAKPASNSTEAIGFVLTYLRNNPTATVDIIGNTDQIGTATMNEKLATARAQNLKEILIKAGVSSSRMRIISKGEDDSVDVDSTDARSLVRKVKFMITDQ